MKAFAALITALDRSNRTSDKEAVLSAYFKTTPAADAAWALYFLTGKRLRRRISGRELRDSVATFTGLPEWMIEACYERVGDLAETIALLLPTQGTVPPTLPLHRFVEHIQACLSSPLAAERTAALHAWWRNPDIAECFVLNKILTGGFRVGVSRTRVVRALAHAAGLEAAVIEHRLMGGFEPTAAAFRTLTDATGDTDEAARPYPFCLAYPLDLPDSGIPNMPGACGDWLLEWKWDGIRAQMIRRPNVALLWSRGDEPLMQAFPEMTAVMHALPTGTVLDGELLAWNTRDGHPDSFGCLQRRLGRKSVSLTLQRDVPVCFMAYDVLEYGSRDVREKPTMERRHILDSLLRDIQHPLLRLSPLIQIQAWSEAATLCSQSRGRKVEGLMLKHKNSPYRSGRIKGTWWKWKVEPLTLDTVLVAAQPGHGRRAGLHTDYTFAVWDDDSLVPLAKAYSGLNDREIAELDTWIRAHTREKHGPVRALEPALVFEIAFDSITRSRRHKSGIAVRFPRIRRWRRDKKATEADTLESLHPLLPAIAGPTATQTLLQL